MRTYDIRLMDYFDNEGDIKRYINFFLLMFGSSVTVHGDGDTPAGRFVLQNPDMFMFKPIEPVSVPSSGKWLRCRFVRLSTFEIVKKNFKRLFV